MCSDVLRRRRDSERETHRTQERWRCRSPVHLPRQGSRSTRHTATVAADTRRCCRRTGWEHRSLGGGGHGGGETRDRFHTDQTLREELVLVLEQRQLTVQDRHSLVGGIKSTVCNSLISHKHHGHVGAGGHQVWRGGGAAEPETVQAGSPTRVFQHNI